MIPDERIQNSKEFSHTGSTNEGFIFPFLNQVVIEVIAPVIKV
jgi:hypothetical protein